jgi:MFS transporter, DHA1 family, tetracycline resistance protein
MDIDSFQLDTYAEPLKESSTQWQHLYILPVLLLEFLALSLTRAVLPSLLLKRYEHRIYLVMGCAECIRGLLAFISCPLFGKLSDHIGRKICLLVTVAGTCAPVCALALLPWDKVLQPAGMDMNSTVDMRNITVLASTDDEAVLWPLFFLANHQSTLKPGIITVFVILFSLSGIFSSTFTLVFAYISDTVRGRDERVTAYGLAMATLGLSFSIGPMLGGYLAQYNTRHVFVCSLVLTILDLLYIYAILPESKDIPSGPNRSSAMSIISSIDHHKVSWNPWDTVRIVAIDPFLRVVGIVAFLYYTALWAVVSTLVLYAAKRFSLGPERLGELMSALGISTMVAEAVLVRIVVPLLGEKQSMRIGLAAFGVQCFFLGFAYEGWQLFICIIFSMVGNLVYPSLSSLVSGSVEPDAVGEALGAVNGIKALTEGIGPLVFGSLLTLSQDSAVPGWPYILAALLVYAAYEYASKLPDVEDDEYIHELERKKDRKEATKILDIFASKQSTRFHQHDDDCEEYVCLLEPDFNILSEIDEDDDDNRRPQTSRKTQSRLPITFAAMMNLGGTKPSN